jgi:phosphohistidine phosphatase
MPKFLYLMRHAQSAEKLPNQHDKDRELTSTGVKEALQIAGFLNSKKIIPDALYTSNAVRAVSTTRLISDALRIDTERFFTDEELYNASVRTFLEFLNNIDDQYTNVLCVGHNPTVSYLAEYLTKAEIGDMDTAGIAVIKLAGNWRQLNQGNGELIEYTTPQMLVRD